MVLLQDLYLRNAVIQYIHLDDANNLFCICEPCNEFALTLL